MIWLFLVGGFQILGFGFTLVRLAYDEWRQWRASRAALADREDRHSEVAYTTWKTATM
jgi:hypothetical protein